MLMVVQFHVFTEGEGKKTHCRLNKPTMPSSACKRPMVSNLTILKIRELRL